jgi:hypothetical protein
LNELEQKNPLDANATNGEELGENSTTQKMDAVDLEKELQRLRSTNERLLAENKQHKTKRQQAEQEKLLAEGKKDEVITQLKTRLTEFEERERSIAIAEAIAKEAEKRGCPKWDHLYRVTGGGDIDIDPDTSVVMGVKEFFDKYQNDPDFDIYFRQAKPIATEIRTPSSDRTGLVSIDYRKNPDLYLYEVKKKFGYDKYKKEMEKLFAEGLIR